MKPREDEHFWNNRQGGEAGIVSASTGTKTLEKAWIGKQSSVRNTQDEMNNREDDAEETFIKQHIKNKTHKRKKI